MLLLRRHARTHGTDVVDLDADLRQLVADYDWPGNFRQLSNVMERIAITAPEPIARLDDVDFAISDIRRPRRRKSDRVERDFITGSMDEIRLRVVAKVLEEENNSKTKAAPVGWGSTRTTLNRWLKDVGERAGENGAGLRDRRRPQDRRRSRLRRIEAMGGDAAQDADRRAGRRRKPLSMLTARSPVAQDASALFRAA